MAPLKSEGLVPAIVLSSHTVGTAIIRALGRKGVPIVVFYYQKNDMGYVSKYVRESVFAPHPERQEGEFIDLLVETSKRYGRALLIPADDETLSVVSRNKTELEKYYRVACPGAEITRALIEKKHTYELADRVGIPAPRTIVPRSAAEVEQYAKRVMFPCLVKPSQSHIYFERFRKKMAVVENREQMLFEYDKASEAGIEVMIQELIPGDDSQGVNYNSYFWDGRPLVEFTAAKVRYSPPGFGVPRVVISKEIPEIVEPGRRILQALGYYGYSCVEFKKDTRDGVYKFMEVNGRHNRSALLALACGINFPWVEYRHLVHGEEPVGFLSYRTGMYWIDEFRDVLHNLRYYRQERYSLWQYLMPYMKPHVFAVFDFKDPRPFMKRCGDLCGMGLNALWGKREI